MEGCVRLYGLYAPIIEDRRRAGALKLYACADGGTQIRRCLVKVAPSEYLAVLKRVGARMFLAPDVWRFFRGT